MARQKSIITLEGSIENLSFYYNKLYNGNLSILKEFAFCEGRDLQTVLKVNASFAGNTLDVDFTFGKTAMKKRVPGGASHVMVLSKAGCFDLKKNRYAPVTSQSSVYNLNDLPETTIGRHGHLPGRNKGHAVFILVAGCLFMQRVNGKDVFLGDKHLQRMEVVYAGTTT
ncbi:MAG: hypothetical protein NVSMB63_02900 [Sediminibacterium sp.]